MQARPAGVPETDGGVTLTAVGSPARSWAVDPAQPAVGRGAGQGLSEGGQNQEARQGEEGCWAPSWLLFHGPVDRPACRRTWMS